MIREFREFRETDPAGEAGFLDDHGVTGSRPRLKLVPSIEVRVPPNIRAIMSNFRYPPRLPFASLAVLLLVAPLWGPLAAQDLPQTWQEEQNFRSGPTPFVPLMQYWYDLARKSELVSLQPLNKTLLGREIYLIVIAEEPIVNPQDAIRSGKPIVFVAPSVHGGEVAPKESFQLVARELVGGSLRHVLEDVIVIGVPLVNPDGGEVLRRTNEAGNGPTGRGPSCAWEWMGPGCRSRPFPPAPPVV